MRPITPVSKKHLPEDGLHDTVIFAENQPQYHSLPALRDYRGRVTTRWRLTWRERLTIFVHGDLWLQVLTFNRPLQPVKLMVEEPTDEEDLRRSIDRAIAQDKEILK